MSMGLQRASLNIHGGAKDRQVLGLFKKHEKSLLTLMQGKERRELR
jgi:hypothetical protein